MDYTLIGNTGIHTQSENDSVKSSKKTTEEQSHSFADTLSNYLPDVKQPNTKEMIETYRTEKRAVINMFLKEYRAETEMKRIELIEKLLSKTKDKDEDTYSKSLEIFKKLMRGEKVSPEEMKYLMMFAPMLFLMYQMLKDGDDKVVEVEPEEENSEQSVEPNIDKSNSSIAQAVLTYSPDTAAAAS